MNIPTLSAYVRYNLDWSEKFVGWLSKFRNIEKNSIVKMINGLDDMVVSEGDES